MHGCPGCQVVPTSGRSDGSFPPDRRLPHPSLQCGARLIQGESYIPKDPLTLSKLGIISAIGDHWSEIAAARSAYLPSAHQNCMTWWIGLLLPRDRKIMRCSAKSANKVETLCDIRSSRSTLKTLPRKNDSKSRWSPIRCQGTQTSKRDGQLILELKEYLQVSSLSAKSNQVRYPVM